MHAVEMLRELIAFDTWANRRIVAALEESGPHARTDALMAHLLSAHDIWWSRAAGEPGPAGAWPEPERGEFPARVEQAHERWVRLLDHTDDAGLERVVTYHNLRGVAFATPLREILVHLSHHGTHHRGQIVATLKQNGHVPPGVDFIVFVRERRGEPS